MNHYSFFSIVTTMKALKTEVQLNVFRLLHSILPLSAGVTKKTNQTMLTPTEDTQHLVLQASNHAVHLCWLASNSFSSVPVSSSIKNPGIRSPSLFTKYV